MGALFSVLILAAVPVLAMVAPEIYFTAGPELEKNKFSPGETIKGSVSFVNGEGSAIGDLSLKFILIQKKDEDKSDVDLLAQETDTQKFSLTANEEMKRNFSYILPDNLPAEDMILRVQIVTGKGEELAWADKKINVSGSGKFLTLDNWWIVKDGKNIDPGVGGFYEEGKVAPEVVFDVTNNSGAEISAFYTITNFKRNSGTTAIEEEKKPAILVKAGEKITIKETLPEQTEPESYLSQIQFFDENDKQPVSNPITFRWIVSGEHGKILFAVLDKDTYAAGDEAQVKISYVGSANPGVVDMGKGSAEAAIFDQDGNQVGRAAADIDFGNSQVVVIVPIEKDVTDPKLEVKIVKDGKALDNYGYTIESKKGSGSPQVAAPVGEEQKDVSLVLWLITGLIFVVAIIIFINMRKKNNGTGPKIAAMFLVFCGSSAAFNAQAAVDVAGCDYLTVWNQPAANQTFHPGDTVRFEGYVQIGTCGNNAGENRFQFYITEDVNIPITNCVGGHNSTGCNICEQSTCSEAINCFGYPSPPSWNGYSCKTYGVPGKCGSDSYWGGGNRMMWVDMGHGQKITKLGTKYRATNYTNKVYFDYTFTIPDNIDINGSARFYIDWVGNHAGQGWAYAIYYQKATIVPNNNKPVATADFYSVNKGDVLSVAAADGVLANDTDADGDELAAVLTVDSTANGDLVLNGDGSLTYAPNAGFTGRDSFTYQAYDGKAKSSPVTVAFDVIDNVPPNDMPEVQPDYYNILKNGTLTVDAANGVLANDTDPDGDAMTAVLGSHNVTNGTLTLNSDGSFTYKPNSGFTGTDYFTYKADDGKQKSNPVTVTITVTANNATPIAYADVYTAQKGSPLSVGGKGVLENDVDPDDGPQPLTATNAVKVTGDGTLTLNSDGSFTFTPGTSTGISQFTYRAYDGANYSAPAAANISIFTIAGEPTANPDSYTVVKNSTLTVNAASGVLANDTDPDNDPITAHKDPGDTLHGALTLSADGSFVYDPDTNYFGTDSFTYWAQDSNGNKSEKVTVTIEVQDIPPLTAQIGCDASGCAGGSCSGSTWIAYQPTSNTPCVFKLTNESVPADLITQSVWDFDAANNSNDFSSTKAGAADYGSLQTSIANDNYTVSLTVADGTGTDSISHDLTVRKDISAGFACSYDASSYWGDCATVLSKGAVGAQVYFRDSSDTGSNYSTPSTGATINHRVWTFNGVVLSDGNNVEIDSNLAQKQNVIRLEVTDTNGRSDVMEYSFKAITIPTWQEVNPAQ